jgi:hypothetical protein
MGGTQHVLAQGAAGLSAAPQHHAPAPAPRAPRALSFQLEGIIPALETSHALAHLEKLCPTLPNGTRVVLNLRRGPRAGGGAAAGGACLQAPAASSGHSWLVARGQSV